MGRRYEFELNNADSNQAISIESVATASGLSPRITVTEDRIELLVDGEHYAAAIKRFESNLPYTPAIVESVADQSASKLAVAIPKDSWARILAAKNMAEIQTALKGLPKLK